jgi:hypothetical protein
VKGLIFNPLKGELNPVCHLLALLGAHHILHVSRIRVKGQNQLALFGSQGHLFLKVLKENFTISFTCFNVCT